MLLIVTNHADYTADFLILELIRLNTEEFPQLVEVTLHFTNEGVDGILKVRNQIVDLSTIKSIWYRRPLPSDISPELTDDAAILFAANECRELLEGLWRVLGSRFWVSDPDKVRVAESKMLQLLEASRLGLAVPQTIITNSATNAQVFYANRQDDIIYKPLRYGQIFRGDNTHLIYTNVVSDAHATQFSKVQFAPTLLQLYVHKRRELRVTVVGERIFAVELHSQEIEKARHDWRRVDAAELRHVPCELPSPIAEKCVALVQQLGLAFGAIDLILTPEGEYVFLEINPNGQWAWVEQLCPELHIREAIIDLLVDRNS
jgi:glutathione synthase/RimK-type ligase-like ATP-grasp enzyme